MSLEGNKGVPRSGDKRSSILASQRPLQMCRSYVPIEHEKGRAIIKIGRPLQLLL